MGMFDRVYISKDMLPINDKQRLAMEKANLDSAQTKSMDNSMTSYTISPTKKLYKLEWELEITPRHKRPNPKAKSGIQAMFGMMYHKNERNVFIEYTGSIYFYYYPSNRQAKKHIKYYFKGYDHDYPEFVAFFKKGILKKIYPKHKVPDKRLV